MMFLLKKPLYLNSGQFRYFSNIFLKGIAIVPSKYIESNSVCLKRKRKKKKKRVTSCIFCCMSSESFRIWNVPSFTFELLSAFLRVVGDRGTIFFFLF